MKRDPESSNSKESPQDRIPVFTRMTNSARGSKETEGNGTFRIALAVDEICSNSAQEAMQDAKVSSRSGSKKWRRLQASSAAAMVGDAETEEASTIRQCIENNQPDAHSGGQPG